MKYPKTTLFLTTFLLIFLLAQDFIFQVTFTPLIEFIQNSAFILLGAMFGVVIYSLRHGNKKPELINEDKLAVKVVQDEKKQLEEKVKTLESALERLMK